MKINKLKALSIAFCCLVASFWSEAKGMDNQKDILEVSETINRTSSIQSSSQNEIAALALEDKASWASYFVSPVKSVIQNTYEVVNYATQNPQKAMIIGFVMAYQLTAVAAQLGVDAPCYKCMGAPLLPGYPPENCLNRCWPTNEECWAICKDGNFPRCRHPVGCWSFGQNITTD